MEYFLHRLFILYFIFWLAFAIPDRWPDTICVNLSLLCNREPYYGDYKIDIWEYNWVQDNYINTYEPIGRVPIKQPFAFCNTVYGLQVLQEPYLCIRHLCHAQKHGERWKYVELHRDFITSFKDTPKIYQELSVDLVESGKYDGYCNVD